MSSREGAKRVRHEIPDDQVPVALEAPQPVGRYTRTLRVLRARYPNRSEREVMESLARIHDGDQAIDLIGARFARVDPEEIEREAVRAARKIRSIRGDADHD